MSAADDAALDGLEISAAQSLELAGLVAEANVDDDVLALLQNELLELTFFLMRSSLAASYRRAVRLRDQVWDLLRRRPRAGRQRELSVIAAKVCTLLAWICEDLGRRAVALGHARAGWMCAEQADHNGARRWIRVAQSRMAFWSGEYAKSAQYAADGHNHPFPDGLDSYLTLLEARARGAAGAQQEALSLLSRWKNSSVYEADPRNEDLFFNLTLDREHYLAGGSLLLLGRAGDALDLLDEAMVLYNRLPRPRRYYGMEMITRIDTVRACLRRGELEAIPAIIGPVLEVQPTRRLTMLCLGIRELAHEISGTPYSKSAIGRELSGTIRDFCDRAELATRGDGQRPLHQKAGPVAARARDAPGGTAGGEGGTCG
ncbi:hypothetical protein BIV23_31520 [Streptomyces monashensis]|uniref:Uncharacterized protein n=1 Tax=Streptomyces monashensis TaxID=1678012 RepID=A0A1S2PU21_9ACTN|nr:hypothetical protein BIV23_31520 [Streptomyces monashensis]